MDRKAIILLVASGLVLLLWYPLVNRLFPPQPVDLAAVEAPATNAPVPADSRPLPPPTEPVWTAPTALPAPAQALARPEAPEELVSLERDSVRYTFTSHGGGLKHVELSEFPQSVACGRSKGPATNNVASLNTAAPVPALTLMGTPGIQDDGQYRLARTTDGVRAEKTLSSGLQVVKEFQLGTNYLLLTSVRLTNQTNQPVRVPAQELVIGTATPLGPHDNATLMGVQWYNGAKAERVGESWFANRTLGCIPGTPRTTYVGGNSNVVWAAVYNQFFTIITVPATNGAAPQIVARRIDLPAPTPAQLQEDKRMVAHPFGFQAAFLYPELILAPAQSVERTYAVFAGPKEYQTLDRLAGRFGNQIDLVMDFSGFFGFFAKALLLSMNGLHGLGLSYGLAIIAITVIIKLLFWPLTQASTRSMKRMQTLQPQMKAIQEKYKDDPKKANQKTMEFMKEHKVNPAAGCLPILIQIPVFIGFYKMLQSAIELRGASFLWACDLAQPDTVWVIPGLGFPLNPLPLIMGATQLWQTRLTPPSPGMDPVQQKIMQYMPLIFLFILYNFSSGLTLYWTVQNLLTIAQMKLTKPSAAHSGPAPGKAAAPARRKP
jgi:YidC/Oxa1 family membrane protein insertase